MNEQSVILMVARLVREEIKLLASTPVVISEGVAEPFYDIAPDTLCGGCAVASFLLWRCLDKLDIKATFIKGGFQGLCHCWVEVGDQIYDCTASQFAHKGAPPDDDVYVTDADDPDYGTDYYCGDDSVRRFAKPHLLDQYFQTEWLHSQGPWMHRKFLDAAEKRILKLLYF